MVLKKMHMYKNKIHKQSSIRKQDNVFQNSEIIFLYLKFIFSFFTLCGLFTGVYHIRPVFLLGA